MLILTLLLACAQRHVSIAVDLPTGDPKPNAVYTASTTTWKLGVSRVQAPFEASQEELSCRREGRLLTAEVRIPADQFPRTLPTTWQCAEEHMLIDVVLDYSP